MTTSYDNVVLIDSQVVLEAKPLDQLPWGDLFAGSILLLVTRQVQTEIDKRKNDGRLGRRARAFNKLLDGFIVDRVPSSVLASPRVDVATVANRSIDWGSLDDLDRDDGDDRIVAQALNALVDDPKRLVLLSHDMRPRDAAITNGLAAVKLPESWLREPDPSPDQRRINELEARNKLLSADQPQLEVRIEPITPGPWLYREVGEATPEQVRAMLDRRLADSPRQSRRSQLNTGFAMYDHSHPERLKAWEAAIREDIPLMHLGLTRLHAQHRIRVSVLNIGPISAEGLSLEIRSGNVVLHLDPYWVLINGQNAPYPRMLPDRLMPLHLDQVVPRREAFKFYRDKRGPGDQLILSCASFRQEKTFTAELSVELQPKSLPKAQIEAVVTASNMKGDARGRLLVDVRDAPLSFDESYNLSQGSLEVRPPFELPDDTDSKNCVLYRNSGPKYKSN